MIAFGGVTATLQMAKQTWTWPILVAPIRDEVLLGIDFLKAANVTIFTGQGDLQVGGEMVPGIMMDGSNTYACSVVQSDCDTVIPPESEKIIIGRVTNPMAGTSAVLDGGAIQNGVKVASCLANMESTIPVRVLNLKDHAVRLTKNTHIGKLVEIHNDIGNKQVDFKSEKNK